MKKIKIFLILFLLFNFSACTQEMVDEVFDAIPFLGIDEEISRAVDLGKPGECEKLKNYDSDQELRRKNKCFQLVAEKINNPKVCRMIVGDDTRWNNCFKSVAAGTKDIGLCDEIKGNSSAKKSCLVDTAIAMEDETVCAREELGTFDKKRCFIEIATNKQDAAVCEGLAKAREKEECWQKVGAAAGDVEVCKKITEVQIYQTRCINEIAIKNKNTDICNEQAFSSDKYLCISMLAEKSNDLSICSRINDEEEKDACISDIAERRQNIGLCDKLKGRDSDNCVSSIAVAKEDVNLCGLIKDMFEKSACHIEIAEKTGQMELCKSMNVDDISRENCLLNTSKKGDDASLCISLENEDNKTRCIINVAQYQRDASHCGLNIESQGTREKCIYETVKKWKTNKVCEPITDPGDKEKCLEDYRILTNSP